MHAFLYQHSAVLQNFLYVVFWWATLAKDRPGCLVHLTLLEVCASSKLDDGCTCQLLKAPRRYSDASNNETLICKDILVGGNGRISRKIWLWGFVGSRFIACTLMDRPRWYVYMLTPRVHSSRWWLLVYGQDDGRLCLDYVCCITV
jgi:hypothetical protein